MNQKVVIYIILSAILLYLYYKRGGVALFAAFVIVVAGTLFTGAGAREGLSLGGGDGGKVNSACAKMGFKPPKIDKKDIKGSLEKTLKNIEKVADKYWQFEDIFGHKPNNDKAKEIRDAVVENKFINSEIEKLSKDSENGTVMNYFLGGCVAFYTAFIGEKASEQDQTRVMKEITQEFLTKAIKGGNVYLTLSNKNHERLEGDDEKKLSSYLICLCKHWISICKEIQKAKGGGGDDEGHGGDEEEDKPKKKKATKKKKKSDEDADEE